MDTASIVEDTERTLFVLRMDGRTNWNLYTRLNFVGVCVCVCVWGGGVW